MRYGGRAWPEAALDGARARAGFLRACGVLSELSAYFPATFQAVFLNSENSNTHNFIT